MREPRDGAGVGITVGELEAARPELFANAAQNWNRLVAAQFGGQVVAFSRYVVATLDQGTWIGDAADAARTSMAGIQGDLSAAEEYMVAFAALLQAAADGISEAQATLRAARNLAARNLLTIDESGAVTADSAAAGSRASQGPVAGYGSTAVQEVQRLVDMALADAQRVVSTLAPRLRNPEQFGSPPRGGSWQADAVTTLAGAQAIDKTLEQAAIPPRGTDAVSVNAWWLAQSASQQSQLISGSPALMGALDGIPAVARDKANRALLADAIIANQTKVSALTAEQQRLEARLRQRAPLWDPDGVYTQRNPSDPTTSWALRQAQTQLAAVNGQLAKANSRLDALNGLEGKLAEGGKPTSFNSKTVTTPPIYLLGFDTKSIGHALVACGNPDTAKNLSVYVPGLNASMLSTHFEFDVQHTQNMTLIANSDTGTDSNATLLWLGYDAPQMNGLQTVKVAGTGNATAAAPDLTSSIKGLRAVNKEINNFTLLGHSYGSLVVGETAKQSALPVDNIVLLGSPGVGVDHASQLGIPVSRVWAGEAVGDPIGRLCWFGPAPTNQDFGANPIKVDANGRLMQAHGEYFDQRDNLNNDPNTSSLRNIASIMTGQYGNVARAPYTYYPPMHDIRPDPPMVLPPIWRPVL